MTPIRSLRERFERDSIPVKWGSIASDLLRLSALARAKSPDSKIFQDVLTEAKLFTEWLAPQVAIKHQETILSLQRALSDISAGPPDYQDIEIKAHAWSDKVLDISGLVR